MPTSLFGHTTVVVVDQDLIWELVRRKREAVKESVAGFAVVLVDDRVVGRVAIVASRDRFMGRLDPCVVVALHDVAIRTRGRVIRQV